MKFCVEKRTIEEIDQYFDVSIWKMDVIDGCKLGLNWSINYILRDDTKCKESHFFDMCRNQRVCISKIGCMSNNGVEMKKRTLLA